MLLHASGETYRNKVTNFLHAKALSVKNEPPDPNKLDKQQSQQVALLNAASQYPCKCHDMSDAVYSVLQYSA
jgi:hypothetical protein